MPNPVPARRWESNNVGTFGVCLLSRQISTFGSPIGTNGWRSLAIFGNGSLGHSPSAWNIDPISNGRRRHGTLGPDPTLGRAFPTSTVSLSRLYLCARNGKGIHAV